MTIGVASLVVAMAVVSGFQTTLKKSVIDSVGHVLVMKRGSSLGNQQEFIKKLHSISPQIKQQTPFVYLEAILAHQSRVSGVVIQGIDPSTYGKVLKLKTRLTSGVFEFGTDESGVEKAVIGKGLAETYQLSLNARFKVVMPVATEFDKASVKPRIKSFTVVGVVDLGRYEWNQRMILTQLSAAQEFAQIGSEVMGYRLRLASDDQSNSVTQLLNQKLGADFLVRNWEDVNRNLVEAAQLEKIVIFFILLIMVIVACFNISSTLFVSVRRRFVDISILKSLGASQRFLVKLFTVQGFIMGFIGSILGIGLGIFVSFGFIWANHHWGLLPGDIYKIENIEIEFRITDLMAIISSVLIICYLSTLAPAKRGAELSPIEGLRNE